MWYSTLQGRIHVKRSQSPLRLRSLARICGSFSPCTTIQPANPSTTALRSREPGSTWLCFLVQILPWQCNCIRVYNVYSFLCIWLGHFCVPVWLSLNIKEISFYLFYCTGAGTQNFIRSDFLDSFLGQSTGDLRVRHCIKKTKRRLAARLMQYTFWVQMGTCSSFDWKDELLWWHDMQFITRQNYFRHVLYRSKKWRSFGTSISLFLIWNEKKI